jgi:hypothetical protein
MGIIKKHYNNIINKINIDDETQFTIALIFLFIMMVCKIMCVYQMLCKKFNDE